MRPVLVIEDGHSSHISMEVIKLAKENDVHLLCLPSHTTHILQPLDMAVFKSLKMHYSIACKSFLSSHPGRVIQSENIASLLGQAWPKALIPINIMSGFKKCGIYPLNPGMIDDRLLAPSHVHTRSQQSPSHSQPLPLESQSPEISVCSGTVTSADSVSSRDTSDVTSEIEIRDRLSDVLVIPKSSTSNSHSS